MWCWCSKSYTAKNSPDSQITSVDISKESLSSAKNLIDKEGIKNVHFKNADIMDLPFEKEIFDHIFVCFVLEHLVDPVMALKELGVVKFRGVGTFAKKF